MGSLQDYLSSHLHVYQDVKQGSKDKGRVGITKSRQLVLWPGLRPTQKTSCLLRHRNLSPCSIDMEPDSHKGLTCAGSCLDGTRVRHYR